MENKRLYFLDNIKVLLTILVISHHTCQAYTIGGDWIIKDGVTGVLLQNFLTVNMTFFMGGFFFIAGYFIPHSRDNKKIGKYVGKKAKRLLIPVLLLLFIVVPGYYYLAYLHTTGSIGFFSYYLNVYLKEGLISYDHGWFIVSLFLYSMLYLIIEKITNKIHTDITIGKIIVFSAIMIILSYLIRLIWPIDTWVDVFGVIGIEPAHLPQYLMWLWIYFHKMHLLHMLFIISLL